MRDRFLRACRREPVDRPPIWIMRQAGRYLPEYREMRQRHGIDEMMTRPELAAEVTRLPFRHFALDAAILYSDISSIFRPMGIECELKEGSGPIVASPIRVADDLRDIRLIDRKRDAAHLSEAVRLLTGEGGLPVPLIGFAGAPFTLAAYLVDGKSSKEWKETRRLMFSQPKLWHRLMELLADNITTWLEIQIESGASAVQLFDSWLGVLSPLAFGEFVLPHMRSILRSLRKTGVPIIYFGTGTATLLDQMAAAGPTVLGIDWRLTLTEASRIAPDLPLQGNLDPALLLAGGPMLSKETRRIIDEGRKLPGHIFNLGHGIYPETPIEHVSELLDIVHSTAGLHA